ncbi:hypothetical protein Rsub_01173 [Raphidocelis subcapitata]|uniref:Amidase domain-containing protein n=1 Tax=Raphidocelis subcapitata TaxID=307507 RepID=A0A2V0NSB3_9CHLO|nr:hypothetical protein Rsub_01173 [Raphidocelis subcapitata]|eukprot:GBF88460.1 hypothetical protein Rsub_01173 [Raphidocelis subcapitata]
MACGSPQRTPQRLAPPAPGARDAADAPDEVQTEDELDSPAEQQQPARQQRRRMAAAPGVLASGGSSTTSSLDLDWDRDGGGGGGGWLRRVPAAVPAVAVVAAAFFLLRAALRGRAPRRGSGAGAADAGKERARRPRRARGPAGAAADAPAAPPPPAAAPAPAPKREDPPEPPATLEVYASPFSEPPQAAAGSPPPPLLGLRLAVSEHVPVDGAPLGLGVPALLPSRPRPAAPAPVVAALRAAGAHVARHTSVQPLAAPTLGANIRNPAAAWRVAGGGASGAAAAVARADADLGIGTELLGGVHAPAACMGLCSFAPTPGLLSAWPDAAGEGAGGAGAGQRDAAAFIAHDVATLAAVADALKLPGNPNLRHELTQVVVAEDLFKLCDPVMGPPTIAIKKAVLQWAGQEQAGSVQLLAFLEGNVTGWRDLLRDADANGDEFTGPDGGATPPVLRALHRAADILHKRDLWQRYGHLLAELEGQQQQRQQQGDGARQQGADGEGEQQQQEQQPPQERELQPQQQEQEQEGEQQPQEQQQAQQQAQHQQQPQQGEESEEPSQGPPQQQAPAGAAGEEAEFGLPAEAVALLREAALITDAQEAAARAVAGEVEEVIRAAVRRDVVVVAPILPSPPPRLDAPADELASFLRRARQFAAVTALAGAPTVTLPLGPCVAADGAPVALALFGQARSDQRLLAVGCKLLPLAQAELEKQQQAEQQAAQQQPDAPAGAATAAGAARPAARAKAGGAAAQQGRRTPAGRGGAAHPKRGAAAANGTADAGGAAAAPPQQQAAAPQPAPQDPKRVERAEKAKARGNELFKKGDYIEAVKAYSEALRHVGDNPVYYSNRAMAYLRAFRFEQAEADCNRALGFDLSVADRVKALLRRGTARQHLYRVTEAAEDFRAAIKLEPNNRQAREELRAIKQQEAELAEAQRAALMQQAGGDALGADGMPGAGEAEGDDFLDPAEFQRLLAAGQVPVLLGADRQPVYGPHGEPVIVTPDGQPMLIAADGEMRPYGR